MPHRGVHPVGWDQSARSAFQPNTPTRGAGPPSSYVQPPRHLGCSPQPTHPLSRVLAPAPGSAARTLSGAILPEPPFKIPHRGLRPDPVPAPKHRGIPRIFLSPNFFRVPKTRKQSQNSRFSATQPLPCFPNPKFQHISSRWRIQEAPFCPYRIGNCERAAVRAYPSFGC